MSQRRPNMNDVQKMIPKGSSTLMKVGAALVGGVWLINKCIFNVDGGQRAVVFNRITGMREKVYGEGTHLIWPIIDRPTIYSVRGKPTSFPCLTGSKDLQVVKVTLRVIVRPNEHNLVQMYEMLGTNFEQRVLPSITNEVLKAVVAQFNASQLINQRQEVSDMVEERLVERARDFNLVIEDVSITDLAFGQEYMKAVEAKQVAQQDAERAKFIVERAREEKRGIIVRATGEAEAAKMISEAVKANPNFLKLRRLEAARDIAHIVAEGENKAILDTDSLLLNTQERDEHK